MIYFNVPPFVGKEFDYMREAVEARKICGDGSFFNRILLSGVLCKQPYLRRTPLGRSICDIILAVGRRYRRSD